MADAGAAADTRGQRRRVRGLDRPAAGRGTRARLRGRGRPARGRARAARIRGRGHRHQPGDDRADARARRSARSRCARERVRVGGPERRAALRRRVLRRQLDRACRGPGRRARSDGRRAQAERSARDHVAQLGARAVSGLAAGGRRPPRGASRPPRARQPRVDHPRGLAGSPHRRRRRLVHRRRADRDRRRAADRVAVHAVRARHRPPYRRVRGRADDIHAGGRAIPR